MFEKLGHGCVAERCCHGFQSNSLAKNISWCQIRYNRFRGADSGPFADRIIFKSNFGVVYSPHVSPFPMAFLPHQAIKTCVRVCRF